MQKLLVDGEVYLLGDICRPRQWKTISQVDLTESGYPVFGANGFIGFYSEYTHTNETIAITCRGSTCGTINLIPPKTYVTGNSMALDELKEDLVDRHFLYYLLRAEGVKHTISGSAQPQIIGQALTSVKVKLPSIEGQQKISLLMDQISKQSDLLEKLLRELKIQKQGLMQKLLTGKVRVKV
jgi:type I restriction enzyme S subunit